MAKPTHAVRAKTGRKDNEQKDVFMTVGAAWESDRGILVRVNCLPVPFDGALYVNPVREPGDDRD